MLLTLTPHPDTPCEAIIRIEVEVARPRPVTLSLRYLIAGDIDHLVLPEQPDDPGRADGLWRTTCLEAFVKGEQGNGYQELNLSPSMQWAAYGFDGYRSGMASSDGVTLWEMEWLRRADGCELRAELDLDPRTCLPFDAPWRLGLSAVIEEASGRKSYWALAHPPGKPDFHHPDAFVATLEPA